MFRAAVSLGMLLPLLASCDATMLRGTDVGPARADAASLDAPRADAPGLDAPGLDAPGAPGLDAPLPELDAFVAPGTDAVVLVSDDAAMPTPVDALAPPDAFVPAPPPPFETHFSRRSAADERDTAIEDRIVQLIDMAVPGSRVRVAIYTFTRAAPSAALARAAMRGVDVRVVLDGDAPSTTGSEAATLVSALGAGNVRVCDAPGTSCIGSGIMHHKTFLFSELSDGSRNVVVQASHNLTTNQLTMHNNAVVIRGDDALFAAYERTWNDLFADREDPNYYRIDDGTLGTRVYFFPRGSGGDTSVSILDNVTCDRTARIRVAMAFFTDARSEVADALAARAREGCDVRVVAGDAEIRIGTTVASTLAGAGVELTRYPERGGGWSLHSKYLLIDAPYSGSTGHRRLVFTGSHNWTGPALRENDETQLRIENDAVFDAFLADWEHVRASAPRP